jgi:drug/metabolite transporter (DMT)-like permease
VAPEAAARVRLRLILAFAAIYLIWGSTYLAIAFAIRTIPPMLMASARFLIAGAVLYGWARWRGGPKPRREQWGWATVQGALFFLAGNGAVVWVEQWLPTGLTALLVATVSVWTALLEWFRPGGTRPTGVVLGGILFGFLGVALLVLPGRLGGGHVDPGGVALLIVATLGWALGSVLSRTADLPKNIGLVAGMEMLAGGVLLLLVSLITGDWTRFDPSGISRQSLVSFLYLVLFGSLVAFTAYAWLLQLTTPGKVATSSYVNPMVAMVLGWAFAGETVTLRSLAASLVIVASVALIITGRGFTLSRTRREPAPSEARGN